MTRATILIPAHNEEAVIARTLWYLSRGLSLGAYRLIVIANGCSDATAARARAILPQSHVIETETPGKCHALNLGYAAADKTQPIICLDADLDVTSDSLAKLLKPLQDGVAHAVCGKMDVDTSEASATVRAFYQGWRANPYFNRGKFGGVFALSSEGAERVFPLPEITADDEYIRRSFSGADVAFVPGCSFVARSPRTIADLIRVRRRSLRGARQVAEMGLTSPERGSAFTMVRRAFSAPSEALSIACFMLIMSWVRLSLMLENKSSTPRWERDMSSRVIG